LRRVLIDNVGQLLTLAGGDEGVDAIPPTRSNALRHCPIEPVLRELELRDAILKLLHHVITAQSANLEAQFL